MHVYVTQQIHPDPSARRFYNLSPLSSQLIQRIAYLRPLSSAESLLPHPSTAGAASMLDIAVAFATAAPQQSKCPPAIDPSPSHTVHTTHQPKAYETGTPICQWQHVLVKK